MAENGDEINKFDTCLRQHWKVGDTLTVHTTPSVEGMVAGTKWVNEVLMVVLVVPPFYQRNGMVEKATLLLKPTATVSRKKLFKYDVPFPNDPGVKIEIAQAAGSYAALDNVVQFLNKQSPPLPPSGSETPLDNSSSTTSPLLLVPTPTGAKSPSIEAARPIEGKEISDKASVQIALSQPDEPPSRLPSNLDAEVISQLAQAVAQQLNITRPPLPVTSHVQQPVPHSPPALLPLHPVFPSLQPVPEVLQSPRRHRSKSLSSGSRSSSSSSRHSHVGQQGTVFSSGIFECPFSSRDTRHFSQPQRRMRAKAEERKYLRRALHDLYSDFTTLKFFVDSLQTSIFAAGNKPYAADLLWLQFHAEYLDCLLLHMTQGPWFAWNELIVDKLARSFLELLVRVSPNRAYPDFIDESVRKWMKRKRVGVATQYGPIPSFLSDARITESGIQPKNGWENWRAKDGKKGDNSTSAVLAKPKAPMPSHSEKK